MKRVVAAAAMLWCMQPAAGPAAEPSAITVPAGTPVRMYVGGDDGSGSRVAPGDTFRARAASDVCVDGLIVVRKDSGAKGPSRRYPAGGSLYESTGFKLPTALSFGSRRSRIA